MARHASEELPVAPLEEEAVMAAEEEEMVAVCWLM
jgi:hypothetical protein